MVLMMHQKKKSKIWKAEKDTKMSKMISTGWRIPWEVRFGPEYQSGSSIFCGLPKKDHTNLKASDLLKLMKQAKEGLEKKFVLMNSVTF